MFRMLNMLNARRRRSTHSLVQQSLVLLLDLLRLARRRSAHSVVQLPLFLINFLLRLLSLDRRFGNRFRHSSWRSAESFVERTLLFICGGRLYFLLLLLRLR